jgi:hypothetical protein
MPSATGGCPEQKLRGTLYGRKSGGRLNRGGHDARFPPGECPTLLRPPSGGHQGPTDRKRRRRNVRPWFINGAVIGLSGALLCGPVAAQNEQSPDTRPAPPTEAAEAETGPPTQVGDQWLDRTQRDVYDLAMNSAMRIDHAFGSERDLSDYRGAQGSLSPALLWDQFDGFQPKLRFRVDLPLPQLNERVRAFIGRVNPDEYVTERAQQSGAFQRQYGPAREDQTLAGIVYRTPPKQGSSFDAGAGVRVRLPLDPYVKGSYMYERGSTEHGLFSLRETLFWQNSEHAGVTTRVDLEQVLMDCLLLRWTTSGSISEKSEGVFGYSAVMALLGLPNRRAVAFEVGFDGETDAAVPLHEYGFKAAYRQSVYRDWLVLELRTSLTWPKEDPARQREPSWGVGIGFEMFFGTDEFLARPVTF